MELILFYVFAVTVVGGGIGVVASRNPVASLMFMVVSLASVAGIYVLLEAHFLAAIQVMVYAGAIMVLFLFVIMLLNLGHDYRDDLVRGLYAVCAFVVSGAICGILATRFGGAETSPLYESFPGAAAMDLELAERGAVSLIARPLFQEYVVPFEITGILLLVAVVGAVALAKKRV
ncbi:MAG: NADH-quinone oxidoreductase subunit J [Gammaproteobacteria bacterium]|nr:NADH-quinone oxidoreductase subunit J [Gammaproteobacteria bacterium]MDE0257424.1 NADH-quinone oxidoreductase subunit J [Gammaproteobacteria bacterium]MDE0359301.1 NADH-quinone oxidoreductase subunit J [Gammaproteobacteria bacterium]MDE0476013.1 NADH-quinone oxidoreductase subunit J [Gammaproteobacteria bacterium]MYC99752.1 NADH-quinone oxidoreductase subunit J [Gammaproteobacteria bacterium]